MGLLERWQPSKEMERFRNEFDNLVERFNLDRDWFRPFRFNGELLGEREPGATRPAIESRVEDGRFIVRTDLPGIDPKDVDIKVVRDVLTIKGSREEKREAKQADFLRREIRYGSFERAISLPEGIRAEDLKATYHEGVLEISAPMPKEAAPKEVKIQIEAPKVNGGKKADAA